jgi:hypothetical protein
MMKARKEKQTGAHVDFYVLYVPFVLFCGL